ncbi:helix-turn-helix domain-containing protein [Natrinema soli]|uniref:Helix-turn-helix domain-containing protein n=1 Tax=Natrinema soli TaxID=1930624 RepID=A0ABD5SU45_9EURY|nr:helix-turn-helix domain-containing protein [Natrinema soli]
MATIAEFRVPTSDTALGATFEEVPSLVCEMEPVVATDNLGVWFSGSGLSKIYPALSEDRTVMTYSIIRSNENRWLCSIEFSDEISELFSLVLDEGGTLLTATATNGEWTSRLRFPAHENVSRAYERLAERDIQVEVTRLQPLSTVPAESIGLTPEQYEALTTAIQYGYFEIPREISQEELADKLDISHQALSERFRRAYRTLVASSIDINKEKLANIC